MAKGSASGGGPGGGGQGGTGGGQVGAGGGQGGGGGGQGVVGGGHGSVIANVLQPRGGGVGHGGGNANVLQPHPVVEQLPGIQYCVNSPPPWFEAIILGFQLYIQTLGVTVLILSLIVPRMGGGNAEKARLIQTTMFLTGINTILQSLFGTRLPTVVGSSYSFLFPSLSIALASRYDACDDPAERFSQSIRGIQGALLISSCFPVLIGFSGVWRNLMRFISPLSVVPIVTYSGLGLYRLGFPKVAECVEVGVVELMLLVFLTQYLSRFFKYGRANLDRYSMLGSVAIVWAFAAILTSAGAYKARPLRSQTSCGTGHAGVIGETPWFLIPHPFQWGAPTFNAVDCFTMMAASFVALIESTGTFIAASRYACTTPIPPSIISRGAGWLGLANLLNGIFGTVVGSTASAESVGLLALTKVGSRRVAQISAVFMIFFSIIGKLNAVFALIPSPIIAACLCLSLAYVTCAGLNFLQYCNLNSFRITFILGFSFFMGLSVPWYFEQYDLGSENGPFYGHPSWFNNGMVVIFMSHATVAGMIAFIFDRTIDSNNEGTKKDNGSKWWDKFIVYSSDLRSEEFYALPFRLNRLFPSY